jgi:hypothetical protein
MITNWLDETLESKEGRLLLVAVLIETTAIVSSYFIVRALIDGMWDASPGRGFLLGWAMWTVPVSLWIGIRGPWISFDDSVFTYLGPALAVAALTAVAVFMTGIVVDIFDCGGGSWGATGGSTGPRCERVFPSIGILLAFNAAVVAMFSIVFFSVVIGCTASKVRSLF